MTRGRDVHLGGITRVEVWAGDIDQALAGILAKVVGCRLAVATAHSRPESNRLQPAGNLNRSVALLEDLDDAAIRHRDEERNAIAVGRELHDLDSQSPQFIRVGKHTLLGS